MKKERKTQTNNLDTYEQSVENALDFKNLKRPSKTKQKKIRAAAKATLREQKNVRTEN